jgi:pimeloyl-ACP methyl ester carboxylesterase
MARRHPTTAVLAAVPTAPCGAIAARHMVSQDMVQTWRFANPVQMPDAETLPRTSPLLGVASRPLCARPGQAGYRHPGQLWRAVQHALANAILQVIDRCGHSPALEKPQEFLPAVREFLAKE